MVACVSLVLAGLAAGCQRGPAQTPAAQSNSGGRAPVDQGNAATPPDTSGGGTATAASTVIEVRFTDESFAALHPELDGMLRHALDAEARRCPGLAFDVGVGHTNYAVEHWVYEADAYLLVFVRPEGVTRGSAWEPGAPFLFVLWPGESRPLSGATLVLENAAGVGSDRAAVEHLVEVAVRHATRELAGAHGIACR